jgi:hypothetical protein
MTRSWLLARRGACLFAIAAVAALTAVPSAEAANIVPNPGFENACAGGIPCNWSPSSSGAITRDTSVHRTGSASLRLAGTLNGSSADTISDCVLVTPGTTYYMRIWYRTTSQSVTSISFSAAYWSANNCTGSNANPAAAKTTQPTRDGGWHAITGPTTALTNPPFDAHSATLVIETGCLQACSDTNVVNYDDAIMDTTPLAVSIYGLRALRSHRAIVLRWRTGTEADTLGFNVFRQQGERRVRVNRRLLPAVGALAGTSYSFTDRRASRRAARYWLQDVDVRGTRTWHGPVRVRAS